MASGEEPGDFIVKFADQSESSPVEVFNAPTSIISGAAKAEPTGATLTAIPEAFRGLTARQMMRCQGRILVYFKANATDIIESEESQWAIPMMVFKPDGSFSRKVLTQENMTGFTQAGTVDVTCTAGIPQRVAYYDVERGLQYAIDPQGKVRAYLGDDS